MSDGYAALTAKEKETLRLLLGGHDAKSMARHLGLSVHTVHERLRVARRKLSVSSSREAARLLQRIEAPETGSSGPDSLVAKDLGGVAPPAPAHPHGQPARTAGDWRRAGWIIGGLLVTLSLIVLALLARPAALLPAGAMPVTAVAAAAPVTPEPAARAAAIEAARSFLARLDRDDWAGAWQATHPSFQLLNTVEWWAQASQSVRAQVGRPLSRELATVDFTAAPPRGYWVITFRARYSTKPAVTETLHMASDGEAWKVTAIMVD